MMPLPHPTDCQGRAARAELQRRTYLYVALVAAMFMAGCASPQAPPETEVSSETEVSPETESSKKTPAESAESEDLGEVGRAPAVERSYEVAIPPEARRLFEAPWVNEGAELTDAKTQHGDFTRLAFDVIYGPIGPYDEALLYIFEPERFEGFRTFILGHGPRGWEGHYVARLGPWESSQMLAVIFEEVGEERLPAPIFTATYLHEERGSEEQRAPEFPYTSVVVWDGESFAIDEVLEERLRGRYEVGAIREGLRGE